MLTMPTVERKRNPRPANTGLRNEARHKFNSRNWISLSSSVHFDLSLCIVQYKVPILMPFIHALRKGRPAAALPTTIMKDLAGHDIPLKNASDLEGARASAADKSKWRSDVVYG